MKKTTKQDLRKIFLEKRNKIKQKKQKDYLINFRLLELIRKYRYKQIAFYFSIRNEIDVLPLANFLFSKGYKISFPIIINKNEKLEFRLWDFKSKLKIGFYKIKTPENHLLGEPNIVIVPLVAFDLKKYRIGYGGGYYDKTLSLLKRKKNFFSVGVAFEEQKTDVIPADKFDERLDYIITPERLIK